MNSSNVQRKRRLGLYFGFLAVVGAATVLAGVTAGGDAATKVLAGGVLLPVYVWMSFDLIIADKLRLKNLRGGLQPTGEFIGAAGLVLFVSGLEIWLIGAPFWRDGSTPAPIGVVMVVAMLFVAAGVAIVALARVIHELFWFR